MNKEQIEAFLFVALTGSFSKSADLLFISQPTVSMRIKTLENTLGSKLFRRSGTNVSLTSEGHIFLPYAQDVLQSLQNGQLAIQQSFGKLKGELAISAVFIAAFYILPNIIEKFHLLYPNIKLNILTGHSHQVLDMVLNQVVPFGITRAVTHPHIYSKELFPDKLVLALYPDHPFQHRSHVTVEDVANEKIILFNRGSLDWTLITRALNYYHLEQNVIIESDNVEMVKRLVKHRLGIAFLPHISIRTELHQNELKEVDVLNLPQINRNFELIYRKDTSFTELTNVFTQFLLKHHDTSN